MPKVLIEADTFDTEIQVPDGDDPRDDAAGDVERIAQRLTNRTRRLQNHTAKLDSANTYTAQNTFDAPVYFHDVVEIDPNTSLDAGIHIDRSGETYQHMISGRAGTASLDRVRIYSGINGTTQGAFFFVVNARLEADGWRRTVEGRKSTALIIRDGDVRVVTRAADATQPWASWQQTTIEDFDSEVLAETFRAARMIARGNQFTDAADEYPYGFRYPAPIARIGAIPLGSCWGNTMYNSAGEVLRDMGRDTPYLLQANYIWFPIPVPMFCSFTEVRVRFWQNQLSTPWDQFQLYKRTQDGPWVAQGSAETRAASGLVVANLHPGPAQVVGDGDEYAYRWRVTSADPTALDNRLVGLSVYWSDIGPNNRIG
jgi:hypothetical protein